MTFSIAVMNIKGGCGKTTIATHLAAAYAVSGLVTALADYDRQKSSMIFSELRPESAASIDVIDWRDDFGEVSKKVQRLVIDCPASLKSEKVREVIREADAIVVPLQPSIYDERATLSFLDEIEQVKKVKSGKKQTLLVANRFRASTQQAKRLERMMIGNGYMIAARIPDRSVYPRLAEQGLTVFDVNTKTALAEQEHWLPLLKALESFAG
ncbi:chromosome partitioning protein [Rhodoligotrophos appendicifer]|uniref:ParA family protein n=1 Tax=Rhodoligotrophos appendicifer TaxID=987056 RepID=UPI00117C64AE|nr:ParA family protein [Rhodoligotrophos appendicifer]